MKKYFLGVCAALFAFAAALTIGAQAAADNVYAILYDDGTLVFQYGDTADSAKTAVKTYAVNLNAVYDYPDYEPWYNERKSVRFVDFADKISPTATAHWFYECENLKRVDNIQNLNTANVTSMYRMFWDCSGLTALDVSNFDTVNVTNMSSMFWGCSGLTALDVSGFDTANVTNMRAMFSSCSGLTALDVSGFNTANVTYMSSMFQECSGLTALDVSGFDTANVTSMGCMFWGCSGLTALDVSNFDTANVTYMEEMFLGCSGLTALDVSNFDTANVTNMSGMFEGCRGLTTLDVSSFDTANVMWMGHMFQECNVLTALDLSRFDTANVTSMGCMFEGCYKLKTIYASDKFTTASVPEREYENSRNMFSVCTSLVGGNGTKFNASHTDKEYARIDAPDAPGYFTAKSSVTYAVEDESGEASAVTDISQVAPGSELVIKPDAPSGDFQTASVFCAVYDRQGAMVRLQVWDVDLSDPLNVMMTGRIQIPENVEVGEIRVFVLSENLVPLRSAGILG